MFLAIDSSLATSVAVVSAEGVILQECHSDDPRGHAETIGSLIQDALLGAGITPAQVRHVVMGVGPGPFTGLRVGMAAAQAFALSRDVPLLPLISHDAPAWERGDVVIMTDARRGEVAFSVYQGDALERRVMGPALCRPENVDEELGRFAHVPRTEVSVISAGALGQVAHAYLGAGEPFASASPQYLRAPDVTVKP